MKKSINQILDNPTKINIYLLPWLLGISFLLRIITVYFIRDVSIANEWTNLLDNLINFKSYSYYNFNNELIPSVFMPPMYQFFLYFLKIISFFEGNTLLYLIFFIQIILSVYSIYLFYQINLNFFKSKLSFINSILFSIIPINIIYCGQISSINLQVILSLLFLKYFLLIIKK